MQKKKLLRQTKVFSDLYGGCVILVKFKKHRNHFKNLRDHPTIMFVAFCEKL